MNIFLALKGCYHVVNYIICYLNDMRFNIFSKLFRYLSTNKNLPINIVMLHTVDFHVTAKKLIVPAPTK